jgi:hypothetical protein
MQHVTSGSTIVGRPGCQEDSAQQVYAPQAQGTACWFSGVEKVMVVTGTRNEWEINQDSMAYGDVWDK